MATESSLPEAPERAPGSARDRAVDRLPSRRAMRNRLARMGARSPGEKPELEPLFRSVRANHPKADLALIERAYRTAEELHATQTRKSGDPYITHPLAVATILADIGMTEPTLVAALLHDTVEDTLGPCRGGVRQPRALGVHSPNGRCQQGRPMGEVGYSLRSKEMTP